MHTNVFYLNKRIAGRINKSLRFGLLSCAAIVCSLWVNAQTVEVAGKIVDAANGESLPGAGIIVEGTTTSTITDVNGKFKIQVPSTSAVLVVTYVGYSSEKVALEGRSIVDIQLKPEVKAMDEVVVIGYGTAKKRDLTGSVSSLKGDDLKQVPVATAAEAITGKIAGVQVTTTEGTPGGDIKIRVRGGGSITQDNSPLYIIDGFPVENGLATVDPLDIESIDVLKDASSSAIYGARGANGVVIVTTKRGKAGKTTVSYDGYYGFKELPKTLELLTPYEYTLAQYELTLGTDYASGFKKTYGSFDELYPVYSQQKGVDWQEEVFGRKASIETHNINVSGGTKDTRVSLGYTRNKEQGILIGTGYKRDIAKLRLDHKAGERLTVAANVSYSDAVIDGGGVYGSSGRLANAVLYKPTNGLTGTAESLLDEESFTNPDKTGGTLYSPITVQKNSVATKLEKKLNMNGSADFKIIKGLTFKVTGGIGNYNTRNDKYYLTESAEANKAGGPWGSIQNQETRTYNNSNVLTYTNKIGVHDFTLLVGNENMNSKTKSVTTSNYQFPNDDIILDNLSLGTSPGIPGSSVQEEQLISFFGRFNYNLMDKYLVQATFRQDGSSKFGSNNRYADFPSASVAWRINQEEFLKGFTTLSNLKLRLSYGQSGNNRISNYLYAAKYTSSFYPLGKTLTNDVYQSSLPNPYLKWETTTSRNLGVDIGFFNQRLTMTADLYQNTTSDLLLDADVPASTGYKTQLQNIGKTENKGIELTISTVNVKTDNFQWTTDFNISFNKNKVVALNEGVTKKYASSGWSVNSFTDYIIEVGQPVGSMYGYVTDGFYKVEDFNYNNGKYTLKPGVPYVSGATPQPGDLKLKDLGGVRDANGNPIISADDDRKIIGNANPKHFGGINNTFTFYGFDLSVFMNWMYGNDIYNANKLRFTSSYARYQNSLAIMRERWMTVDETGTLVTDPEQLKALNKNAKIWKYNSDLATLHSWAIEDGSFLRINTITLGYTLPKKLTKKVAIQSLRIYGTAYNPFLFTNYTGYDPEVDSRSNVLTPGVDYSAYPKTRSLICGVNITF